MRRRRRSPATRIIYLVILLVVGLVLHHRVSSQFEIEGGVLLVLVGVALFSTWNGRRADRALMQANQPPPRRTEPHAEPDALDGGQPDDDVAAGRGS